MQLTELEQDVRSIGDEDAAVCVNAFLFHLVKLFEELGNVDDGAIADKILCAWSDETTVIS